MLENIHQVKLSAMHSRANKLWLLVIACLFINMQVNARKTGYDTPAAAHKVGSNPSIFKDPAKGILPHNNNRNPVRGGADNKLKVPTRNRYSAAQRPPERLDGRNKLLLLARQPLAKSGQLNFAHRANGIEKSNFLLHHSTFSTLCCAFQPLDGRAPLPTVAFKQTTADTLDPRTVAYEKALDNARALKKVGAYGLARIEYDRAMRLNTKNISELQKEKEELPRRDSALVSVEEVEEVPVPGSPQWRYDSVVAVATRQYADRRFDSAIVNYREAGQILPEQTFPGSQLRAIDWELDQIWKGYLSARTEKLNREVRAALAQKQYTSALSGLYELMQYNPRDEQWVKAQFANVERLLANQGLDTDSILAAVAVPDVWDVIAQKRPAPPQPAGVDTARSEAPQMAPAAGAAPRKKVVVTGSVQAEAIPYPAALLAELYPGVDFTQHPPDQPFNLIDDQAEHAVVINQVQKNKPSLQISDSTGNIKVTCEGIYFNGMNTYLKIRISNNSVADFPVGPMLLSWKQRGQRLLERIPVSVSDYPIVQSGKYFSLVYVCRSVNMRQNEQLYFSLQGRLGFPTLQIPISGKIYNQEKNKSVNQL